MLPRLLYFAALAAAAVKPLQRACGTVPDATFLDHSSRLAQAEVAAEAAGIVSETAAITVPTYFHIIASSKKLSDGYATQGMVNKQLAVMNKAYQPAGVTFNLVGTDWTINSTWANGTDELGMSNKLRKGGYNALNIYFTQSLNGVGANILGFCYFPVSPKPAAGTEYFNIDGCRVVSWSMPGGSPGGQYNGGMTAVHETGHWFGLLHPFQGNGCIAPNDYVKDTPVQKTPTYGCPKTKDTCPGNKGHDNIHNYMDYADDTCMNHFTKGQITRLQTVFKEFRQ